MYSIGLILACVATTALAETNAENADSQVATIATIRALLNDLNAAKATIKRQSEALEAAKATIDASTATQKEPCNGEVLKTFKAQAAGLKNERDESGSRALVGEEGYGDGTAYGGGYGSKKKAAAAKTSNKANPDAGAAARQIVAKLSPVTEQYTNPHHTDLTPDP